MTSLLEYIPLFVENSDLYSSSNLAPSDNKINSVGDSLEEFIKCRIANINRDDTITEILEKKSKVFSYLGNTNNIPDAILENGDAIEIKKVQSVNSQLALNSSYPKDMLHCDDTRIKKEVKMLEDGNWKEKTLFYIVGCVPKGENRVSDLLFLDGSLYAARRETYEELSTLISDAVTKSEGVEFYPTNELGKVKKVDPLGRTDLRIRGMWHIESPFKTFSDFINTKDKAYNFCTLVSLNNYNKLSDINRKKIENHVSLEIKKIKVQDPNNGAKLIEAVMVSNK